MVAAVDTAVDIHRTAVEAAYCTADVADIACWGGYILDCNSVAADRSSAFGNYCLVHLSSKKRKIECF